MVFRGYEFIKHPEDFILKKCVYTYTRTSTAKIFKNILIILLVNDSNEIYGNYKGTGYNIHLAIGFNVLALVTY